ncbi:helix-turn-helix transcriptional regulator [Lentzea sp. BCCO 10_0061]|uniref:Helix-turn-helix transcriptional regulator n=1 Tax=Lentzea sokolovensis TaxID=3095429 RepID=A0ABU4V0G4_9PSEU|nr:helix-turn-helix transcriptional regulator [Lentzea sp. BCCO 10_0061]MDX8144857.1 helix-turn-helix transcriptional regulator [Lentzea sp. BCCO 10_0061]
MPRKESPVVLQKRLLAELRQTRDGLGLSQQAVADAMDWSVSKLIRIEKGENKISVTDVQALLFHYGVRDDARVAELVGMTRAIRQSKSEWMEKYRGSFSEQFARFVELEASAIRVRQCQLNVIPGLIQVPEYAMELVTAFGQSGARAERGVEIRMHRQVLLEPDGPEIVFCLDEAVLHRVVGGEDVLRKQLVRMKEVCALPNMTIQILPFAAGIHPSMKGSFSILEFSEGEEDFALLLEFPGRDEVQTSGPELKEYLNHFYQLENFALPASETPKMIDRRLEELGGA